MGHHHSKSRSARQKSKTRNQSPTIEHHRNFQNPNFFTQVVEEPIQYSIEPTSNHPSKPRPIRTSKTRTSNYQPHWRDPSPQRRRDENVRKSSPVIYRRQPERAPRNKSHHNDRYSYDYDENLPVFKRNAKSLSPKRSNQGPTKNVKDQPRKLKETESKPMSKSAPTNVVESAENRGRPTGRFFCVVRCRSEPTNALQPLEPFVAKRPQRKAISASPPRKQTRSNYITIENNNERDNIYQNDEIAISFEQVEPQTYRVVGGKTTVGPVPKTNKIAPRPLRRTFPQLIPKSLAQSPRGKSVSDSKLLVEADRKALRFTQPPIPPRKHRLRDLSHLVTTKPLANKGVKTYSANPLNTHFTQFAKPISINDKNKYQPQSQSYSPERIYQKKGDAWSQSPVARSPVTRSPVSRSPVNRSPMTNRKRDEFTESVESISTQSGSYHLPSSGYTPNERSLVDSPYGFEDINVLETEIKSIDKFQINDDQDFDDLEIITRSGSRNHFEKVAPRPFDPGGRRRLKNESNPELNQKSSLLWSNPSPFNFQKKGNVIRHVEAPKPKTVREIPPKPIQKFTPAGRYEVDSSKFGPVELDKQFRPTRRSDQFPQSSSRQQSPNPIRESIYKEIVVNAQNSEENPSRGPKTVKSSIPRTYRPSINQIVRGLAQNAYLRDESPLRQNIDKRMNFGVYKTPPTQISNSLEEENLLIKELEESRNFRINSESSRTVEVVYVPQFGHKKKPHQLKVRPRSQPYVEPPIILSDDGHGTNFIDLTQPPSSRRDSWNLPV